MCNKSFWIVLLALVPDLCAGNNVVMMSHLINLHANDMCVSINAGNGRPWGRDLNGGINILACIGILLKVINYGIQTVFKLITGLKQYTQYIKRSNRAGPRCGKRCSTTQRFVNKPQKCNKAKQSWWLDSCFCPHAFCKYQKIFIKWQFALHGFSNIHKIFNHCTLMRFSTVFLNIMNNENDHSSPAY